MGYIICRVGHKFRSVLVRAFPLLWGEPADACIYETKGDAERIRMRLGGKTVVTPRRPQATPAADAKP